MPAIDFPAAPAVNDEYSFEGRTWLWNGTGWEVKEYPAALLAGTAANPSLYFSGDPNTGLYSPGADQVAISTAGTGRLFVDSNGRVGIGTSPSYTLQVAGAIATQSTSPSVQLNDSTVSQGVSFGFFNGGVNYAYGQIALRDSTNSQTAYTYSAGASGYHNWFTAGTERLRITSDGKVGIGTSSPVQLLHINTTGTSAILRVSSGSAGVNTSTSSIQLSSSFSGSGVEGTAQINANAPAGGQSELAFLTSSSGNSPTERARIDSSGRLLVGASASRDTAIGGALLQVEGTTYGGSSIQMVCNSAVDAVTCAHLAFGRSKTTSVGGTGQVVNGDRLGAISWNGAQNSTLSSIAGLIECYVDGEVQTAGDTTDMPGRLVFSTTADGAASPTERMRINSSGHVGIGTTAPRFSLSLGNITGASTSTPQTIDLGGTYSSTAGENPKLRLYWDNTNSIGFGVSLNQLDYICNTGTSHVFHIGATERARIDSSGRLLVGTTSATNSAHFQMSVGSGASATPYAAVFNTATSPTSSASTRFDLGFLNGASDYVATSTVLGAVNFMGQANDLGYLGAYVRALVTSGGNASRASGHSIDLVFGTKPSSSAGATERARIDSSGRLLVGTTADITGAAVQTAATTGDASSVSAARFGANASAGYLSIFRSRGATVGTHAALVENDGVGAINFYGSDGAAYRLAAAITTFVDGGVASADMPGRLVFSTTVNGASASTEQLRITNGGTVVYNQPAPAAVNTTATLTVANLTAKIITSTTAAAVTMTLPTGTDMDAGFSGLYTNMAFEWSVINTGATNAVTVQGGTGHTVVGSGTVAASNSGCFVSRRTAATTWVTYRLSS